jgi:hypothetical protein
MPVPDRFAGTTRAYTQADVERLRGSVRIEHTLARLGAERFWRLLAEEPYVPALGALTGAQAVQSVAAGARPCSPAPASTRGRLGGKSGGRAMADVAATVSRRRRRPP